MDYKNLESLLRGDDPLRGPSHFLAFFSISFDFRFHIFTLLSPRAFRLCTRFLSKSDHRNPKKKKKRKPFF